MKINWKIKQFSDLTPYELYEIIKLRLKVFSIEQNCIYQDLDDKDFYSQHLLGFVDGELAAYTRLIKPGIAYKEASIGRVVVDIKYRKHGLGKELMRTSVEVCGRLFGGPIKIGAEFYLKKFYEGYGFIEIGDKYIECNIEHIEMIKK